jgi:ABC-2 type transport system permease protein
VESRVAVDRVFDITSPEWEPSMMRSIFTKTLYDLLLYPSFADAQEQMFSGLAGETAQAILGDMNLAGTPEGYLNLQLFPFLPLFVAIFLIIATSQAIAGEESAKTLGILLARPVSRFQVLAEKALAFLLGTVVILVVMAIGAVAGALVAGVDLPLDLLALSIIAALPYGIWLLGFGLFCSAFFKNRMVAALVATGVVAATYMFNSLTEFNPDLRFYNQFMPMYYYAWGDPLLSSINWRNVGILVAAGAAFYIFAVEAFRRREVHG